MIVAETSETVTLRRADVIAETPETITLRRADLETLLEEMDCPHLTEKLSRLAGALEAIEQQVLALDPDRGPELRH